jgi:hypothetical protein
VSYSVVVFEQVKNLLEKLYRSDRMKSRQLALLLLRLEKDPRPDGSRVLATGLISKGKPPREQRVWEPTGFRIAYIVSDKGRTIEVGIVTQLD